MFHQLLEKKFLINSSRKKSEITKAQTVFKRLSGIIDKIVIKKYFYLFSQKLIALMQKFTRTLVSITNQGRTRLNRLETQTKII